MVCTRSTDGGGSWSRVDGPWGVEMSSTRSPVGRIELALAPSNPDVVYASIQLPPNGGSNALGLLGLYRTDNAWADSPTWIEIPTDATGPGGYCGPSKCGYSHVISVDPRDANTLFAGGAEQGFWRCTNCGASPAWTDTTRNKGVHPDHHALAWAGNRLIDGNDGGLLSTVDLGASWQNHNRTLATTMFYGAALHPADNGMILAGPRDFSLTVFRPSDGWRASASGYRRVGRSGSRHLIVSSGVQLDGVVAARPDSTHHRRRPHGDGGGRGHRQDRRRVRCPGAQVPWQRRCVRDGHESDLADG